MPIDNPIGHTVQEEGVVVKTRPTINFIGAAVEAVDNPSENRVDVTISSTLGAVATITFIIDGGGSAITTGEKGHLRIPFGCTINRATALADQSGSIVVDIWNDTYGNFPPADGDSITASAPVTISGDTDSEDSTLTGWDTSIAADDILAFNVDSVTDIERLTISLKVTKT